MCGIWFCLGNFCPANVNTYVDKIKGRGPEDSKIITAGGAGTMGFNRLAINGLNPEGMQPMNIGNKIFWMCNGEIYNWADLAKEYNIDVKSQSDCEVLGELYVKTRDNLENFFQLLDGVS